jgi:hypothetical protein
MPGGFVCSGSLKGVTSNARAAGVIATSSPVRRLFSKEQRRFFEEHAPEGVKLDDLGFLGPIFVLKTKWLPEDFGRPMIAEMWLYPDGSRILELSTKCLPQNAFQIAVEAPTYLSSQGVNLSGAQETKTKKALQFFTASQPEIGLAA